MDAIEIWSDAARSTVTSDKQRCVVDVLARTRGGQLSVSAIAAEAGTTRDTVYKAFRLLHERGMLARHGKWIEPGEGLRGHVYTLVLPLNTGIDTAIDTGMVEPNAGIDTGVRHRDGYAESGGIDTGSTAMRSSSSCSVREGSSPSLTEQAEQSLAELEAIHGPIIGQHRNLVIASLRENAEGVRACYRRASAVATRNVIGVLIRMLQAGEHRYVVCFDCARIHVTARDRSAELGVPSNAAYVLCDEHARRFAWQDSEGVANATFPVAV